MNKKIKNIVFGLYNIFGNNIDYRTKRITDKYEHKTGPEQEIYNDGARILIAKDLWFMHRYYVLACQDLNVNYKVVDITSNSWNDEIEKYQPDAILAWPTVVTSVDKSIFDTRLKLISDVMCVPVFPSLDGLWFWESKHRMTDWLNIHGYITPKTWMFNSCKAALVFSKTCKLPIVFKSESGSGGRGVRIFKSRTLLNSFIRSYFRKGFLTNDRHKLDNEWGNIFLQEYLERADEWRIMRVGDSFFGYKKLAVNGLHSGSSQWEYAAPPIELLNDCKRISDDNKLYSVAIDYFISTGKTYINEVQVYFGMAYKSEMCVVDNKAGRFIEGAKGWEFEAGSFCSNNLCNERVKFVINNILQCDNEL
ncbi:ATP-grasp domain-containing protein [Neptunomonas japonica]|uniref:ATP-grasp domain-containing protein n=1 Tax=Neptunomonas japonica TaxID=417574 RepID=UPI00041C391A|nr:hypothetical protein [Neptunomonas japonica]